MSRLAAVRRRNRRALVRAITYRRLDLRVRVAERIIGP